MNLYKVLVTLLLINCPIARCRHPRLCRASAAGRGQAAVNQDCQVHMKLCHGHGVATRVTDNYNFARTNQETGRRGKVCIITKRLTSGKLLLCVSPIWGAGLGWAGLGWAGLGSGTEHVIHQQLGRQELMSEPFINARVDMFSNEDWWLVAS